MSNQLEKKRPNSDGECCDTSIRHDVRRSRLAVMRAVVVALMALASTVGCGSGPKTAPVVGSVSYKGKPVTTGTVTFYPVEGGRPAVGGIKPDGSFTLARTVPGDNVIVGDYKVTIEATESAGIGQEPDSLAAELAEGPGAFKAAPPKQLVPAKYSTVESSGLTVEVRDADNNFNFELK